MGLVSRHVDWPRSVHIAPGRFPVDDPFERVAAGDLAAVHELEAFTDNARRHERGEITSIPPRELAGGLAAAIAPFINPAPGGSRFSAGKFGVYYAARDEYTGIIESVFECERFLAASNERPMRLGMRMVVAEMSARLVDLRGTQDITHEGQSVNSLRASKKLGESLRRQGEWGVVYNSTRHPGGECVALFRSPAVRRIVEIRHLEFAWNGLRITDVLEVSPLVSFR